MRAAIILFAMCWCLAAQSQSERFFKWYFGNRAGLDFSPGAPSPLLDGQLVTTEGCATMSDASGGLLFYTDGIRVWNKNHMVMPNGTGLMGHISSTQSAIIVQKPGSTNEYLIFTADADVGPNGIRYSVVDMNAQSGLGDVTTKNLPLHSSSCEKLAAVKHCNGRDIWIITHDWQTNGWRTWLLTNTGVNLVPVLSNSGSVIAGIIQAKYGQLKSNFRGDKLLSASYGYASGGANRFELHHFDNSTGVVSGSILLANEIGAYGCEFSPDGRLAYGATNGGRLVQFDLCAGTTALIQASKTLIWSNGPFIGSLQLGTDGKIYVSRNSAKLSVINNPNSLGLACNYTDASLSLSGRNSGLGLPCIASYHSQARDDFTWAANCLSVIFVGPSSNMACVTGNMIVSYLWKFGDGTTSGQQSVTHQYLTPGAYSVSLELQYKCHKDTVYKTVNLSGNSPSIITSINQ